MPNLANLDAYLARIGAVGRPSFAELHRCHATTIPFENLESSAGRSVPLDTAQLEDKLVARRRGGYCFEHNLLMAALESIGVDEVVPLLARVRMGGGPEPGARNHLLLRVVDHNEPWLADVGFGGGGLLDPIPLRVGRECEQSGWRYRIVEDGTELVLQVFQDGAWTDLFGFSPEPVPLVDIEVSNWYTATHPSSPFVCGVIIGMRSVDRHLTFMHFDSPVLIERELGRPSVTSEVPNADVPGLLATRFGIPGTTVRSDGRPGIGAPEPAC